MSNFIDLTGNKYGKLTVLERLSSSKYGIIWLCKCECGSLRKSIGVNLKLGKTVSCGCGRRGKNSSHFSGFQDIGSHYWGHVKSNARNRNLEFEISKKVAWDLFIAQECKCALTGLDIRLCPSAKSVSKLQTASLDRIDSSKGYVLGNIQWLHKDINKMKNAHGDKYFIYLCNQVSEFRAKNGSD